jgi:N-acetylglutamate synthase-like GNAT family acetyltransferase
MLKRAVAIDVDGIVAFEARVMDRKLYGKPLDHDAARSEIGTNEYYVHLRDGRVIATGALRRREDASVYRSNIAVHPDNRPARALYASLGFAPTRCQENYFGDGEPRLIMVRSGVA